MADILGGSKRCKGGSKHRLLYGANKLLHMKWAKEGLRSGVWGLGYD